MKIKSNKLIIIGVLAIISVFLLVNYTTAFKDLGKSMYKATHDGQEPPLDMKLVNCDISIKNTMFLSSDIESINCNSNLVSSYDCPVGNKMSVLSMFTDSLSLNMYAESAKQASLKFIIDEGARKAFTTNFCVSQYAPNIRFVLLDDAGNFLSEEVKDI